MTHTTNLGASSPLLESGKSLRIPIERTRSGTQLQAIILFWAFRRPPALSAHVKR
jgi:hypothetical protein